MQGGSDPIFNHHYRVSAQRYALDIVQLNRWGLRASRLIPNALDNFSIYGAELFSPCEGTIVAMRDGCEEAPIGGEDTEQLTGNFLAIADKSRDLTIILAHLQKGSIAVQEGAYVQKGQFLGRVGNSGNTTEPHLHIHAVRGNDWLFEGEGVPITFNSRFWMRGQIYHSPRKATNISF